MKYIQKYILLALFICFFVIHFDFFVLANGAKCSNFWINPQTGERECLNQNSPTPPAQKGEVEIIKGSYRLDEAFSDVYFVYAHLKNNTPFAVENVRFSYELRKYFRNRNGIIYRSEVVHAGVAPPRKDKVLIGKILPGETERFKYPLPSDVNVIDSHRVPKEIKITNVEYTLTENY